LPASHSGQRFNWGCKAGGCRGFGVLTMQTFLETEQNLALLLEQAQQNGEVRIRRENGQSFVLKPETATSPLDVESIDLGVSSDEIVAFIRAGRERF